MSRLFRCFIIVVFSISTLGTAVPPFKQIRIPFIGEISDIAVADLNKDGFDDIVTIDHDEKKIRIFMGDAKFGFSKQYVKQYQYLGEYILGIADFTGNGKLDITIDSSFYQTYFVLFPGIGNGKIGKAKAVNVNSGSSSEISHASVSDFNGDGKPDIVGLVDGSPDFLGTFINQGNGKFNSAEVQQKDYHSVTSGDFDNDGDQDILVGDLYTDDVTFFKNQGNGNFTQGTITNIGNIGSHLNSGFLNKDNRLDIVGSGNSAFDSGWSMLGKKNGKFVKKKSLPKYRSLGDGFCLIDFPWPLTDYTYIYRTTGAYLHFPGQTTGVVNFSLTLPTTSFSTGSPQVALSNFSLWDYNLVHSNILLKD